MEAVAQRFPEAYRLLETSFDDRLVVGVQARSGDSVAAVRTTGGSILLNSRYDPVREAVRVVGRYAGTVVMIGTDSGYLAPALLDSGAARVLLVEPDPAVLAGILHVADLSRCLRDRRIQLHVGVDGTFEWIQARYLPVLHGDAYVYTPTARARLAVSRIDEARRMVSLALDGVADDSATQGRLGRLWTRNILLGVSRSAGLEARFRSGDEAAVVAAGPSLNGQMDALRHGRHDLLVAVDTALPALLRHGVVPSYVVSIDPQVVSYHHALTGVPKETIVVSDIGSPPFGNNRRMLFSGAHPLAGALRRRGLALPVWDTSGGSVTQTAVDFCRRLGVRRIRLYGADYSYGNGTAYAAGTYVYDVFRGRESRLRTVETQNATFVFARATRVDGSFRSALLDRYRARFDAWCRSRGLAVSHDGVLELPAEPPDRLPDVYRIERRDAARALEAYRNDLARVELDSLDRPIELNEIPQRLAEVLATVLPPAAALDRSLERARGITLEYVERALALLT
jgi:hypothetical protein